MTDQKSLAFNYGKSLLLNELIWGTVPEELHRTEERLGISLEIDVERLYVCLTGIQHNIIRKAWNVDGLTYFIERYKPACAKIQEAVQRKGYDCTFFIPAFDGEQRICFLISENGQPPQGSIDEIAAFIHNSICRLYREFPIPSELYNHTVYTEWTFPCEDIPMLYQKLKLLCDSMFFFPKNTVLGASQFQERPRTIVYDMTRDISRLENAIAGGDQKKANEIMEQCIWDNLCPIRSINMLKTFVTILTEKIRRILYAYEIDFRVEESRLYPEKFNNIRTFYQALHESVMEITKMVAKSGRQLPTFIYEAILYIRDHIREDISLRDVAEYVFVSPSHLSRSFSSCMGKSISAYIRKERMKLASQLLCETNMTGTAVAEAVGIRSHSYFAQLFCEEFGITPREYRKLYAKANGDYRKITKERS